MSETSPTSEPSVANTGAPIKSAVISAASMSILPGGSARMAVGTLMVMLMAVASVNTTPRGCPSFAPTRTQRFMVYDAFFPHTAINSARVTLSLLANEAGNFCLKLPISLALRTPSLSRSAAVNCSVHCFSSMGVAFWACRGNEVVTATRNRRTILDIGTPWSTACRPSTQSKRTRQVFRSLGATRAREAERTLRSPTSSAPPAASRSLGTTSPQGVVPSLPVQLVFNRTAPELAADRGVAASSGCQVCRPRSPRDHARGGDDEPALAQPSNCQASCDLARANISRSRPSTNQVSRLQTWPRSAPYCCWG